MHEMLAETYVNRAKAHERGDVRLPHAVEPFAFALVSVARQRDATSAKLIANPQ